MKPPKLDDNPKMRKKHETIKNIPNTNTYIKAPATRIKDSHINREDHNIPGDNHQIKRSIYCKVVETKIDPSAPNVIRQVVTVHIYSIQD